jgi:hypothetical protein
MYYVILPNESVLDYLKDDLYAEYAASVFITMDKSKATNVLHTLNNLLYELPKKVAENSLISTLLGDMTMVVVAKLQLDEKNEPAFQIKVISEVEKSRLVPDKTISYKSLIGVGMFKSPENTETYPYNYIFMEAIPNAEPTIQEMKKYVDTYCGDKEIIQKIRSTLGEKYI